MQLKVSEAKIQSDSIKELRNFGYLVIRLNSGLVKGKSGHFVHLAEAGTPDIEVILKDNQICFIEFKNATNQPSDKQIEWHNMLQRRNAIHGLSRSVADTIKIVTERLVGFGY